MKKLLLIVVIFLLSACASNKAVNLLPTPVPKTIEIPESALQGSLVVGRVPAGSTVFLSEEAQPENTPSIELKIAKNGRLVFGIGRDETRAKIVSVRFKDASMSYKKIVVTARKFDIENITGVPQETVTPNPASATRIDTEQAQVTTARLRNDDRQDFDTKFIWPVQGRVSGVYGSQRIYNGTPKSWHSGLDIAAVQGTPVKAPAGGIIVFAKPDLFLTGGTILIDHGMGISSNFLHLSRLDVKLGDRVEQGQVIGLVGMTGRATGPHMHWGMNWLKVRIDPQLLVLNKAE